jgi:hypothetical protein
MVLLLPVDDPRWGRIWSPFNKNIKNGVLVIIGDYFFIFVMDR